MRTQKDKNIKVYFTMNQEKYYEFENYVNENLLDKSRVIEKLILKYLEEKNI